MARSVSEWIGRNPDSAIPPRVMVRIFGAGICAKCGRRLQPGKWAADHIVALVNGGEHRERNLQPLCVSPCHSDKTRADVAEKSRVYRKAAKNIGVDLKPSRKRLRGPGFRKARPQRSASRPINRKSGNDTPAQSAVRQAITEGADL